MEEEVKLPDGSASSVARIAGAKRIPAAYNLFSWRECGRLPLAIAFR